MGEIDWRMSRRTIIERVSYLCNSDELSDVEFIVQGNTFHAHKVLLGMTSSVFASQFGELPADKRHIEVTDVSPETFQRLLDYVYKDQVDLSEQTLTEVWSLWRASQKYRLSFLTEKCQHHIYSNLTPINVLEALHNAQESHDEVLQEMCMQIIDSQAKDIFTNQSFTELSKETVKEIISRDTLQIDEIDVFRAVVHWIQKRFDPENDSVQAEDISDLLACVKYYCISVKDFLDVVTPEDVLGYKEWKRSAMEIMNECLSAPELLHCGKKRCEVSGLDVTGETVLIEKACEGKMDFPAVCLPENVTATATPNINENIKYELSEPETEEDEVEKQPSSEMMSVATYSSDTDFVFCGLYQGDSHSLTFRVNKDIFLHSFVAGVHKNDTWCTVSRPFRVKLWRSGVLLVIEMCTCVKVDGSCNVKLASPVLLSPENEYSLELVSLERAGFNLPSNWRPVQMEAGGVNFDTTVGCPNPRSQEVGLITSLNWSF